MKNTPEVIRQWFETIEEEGYGLTKWEESFIESVRDQFDRTNSLSDKQEDILERIYSERTP